MLGPRPSVLSPGRRSRVAALVGRTPPRVTRMSIATTAPRVARARDEASRATSAPSRAAQVWRALDRLGALEETPGLPLPILRIADVLREALSIEPTEPVSEEIANEVFVLGTTLRDGALADVLVAIDPFGSGLARVFAALADAEHPVIVLLPQYGVGDLRAAAVPSCVELLAIEDAIEPSVTGIRASAIWTRPRQESAVAVCVTEQGTRRVDLNEYEALVASADRDLDLLIDLVGLGGGRAAGEIIAGFRRAGRFETTKKLTLTEASALVELVEHRGTYLRVDEMKSLRDVTTKEKIVQRGRRGVDEEWRLFHKQPGATKQDLAYGFLPPKGTRFAVLKPVR